MSSHFSHVKTCSLLVRYMLAPCIHLADIICSETKIFIFSVGGLFSVAVFHSWNVSDEICLSKTVNDVQ